MQAHMLNKSFMTNFIAFCGFMVGMAWNSQGLISVGLFALSGGLTNWIAIHMLFERVPGLYGSGVIQNQFTDFKRGIEALIMNEFFTANNISTVITEKVYGHNSLNFKAMFASLPLDKAFDALLEALSASSMGALVNMIGGTEALRPMQPAFEQKMRGALEEITETEEFSLALSNMLQSDQMKNDLRAKIDRIVKNRLDELTPTMVKNLMQTMIRQHLGWLVVWGGIFGGLLGLVAYYINTLT